jgi:hypothetical protein
VEVTRPRLKENKKNKIIELNGSHIALQEGEKRVTNIIDIYCWQNLSKVLRSCSAPSSRLVLDFG